MKAARLVGPEQIRYLDIEPPKPAPDEVLIRVECVGICGTDVELYKGTMPYFAMGWTEYPITPGHEWSGTVVDRGSAVQHLRIADRVTGDVGYGCGNCDSCRRGDYHLCVRKIEVGLCRGKDGAFAEYLTMPARHSYRVPDELSLEEAALAEPTATVVKAIRKARFEPGAVCVIVGDGPIGLLGLQAANACGAGLAILTGTVDHKLEVGRKLGADVTVNVTSQDPVPRVRELTGGVGADFVMEASGSVKALQQAIDMARMGGTVSIVGIHDEPVPNLDMGQIVVRDLNLITSLASPNVFDQTLRLMGKGKIDVRPLISHWFELSEAEHAFHVQRNQPQHRTKILLTPNAS